VNESELLQRIKELEEENQTLKNLLERKTRNSTAYEIIANLITNKVNKDVHQDWAHTFQTIKRRIMDDLKWELHVRYANDFTQEDIEKAKDFINKYEVDGYLKSPKEIQ